MPAGSKRDPPLAKAEPISNVKKGKKTPAQQLLQQKRGVRICERNNSADTKVSEEGGGGGAPGTRAEIPLQPVVKTTVRQAVPLHPWRLTVEQNPPAAHGGPHTGAGGCAQRTL
ncbi:unnamed protein product [Bubo scandiacus]